MARLVGKYLGVPVEFVPVTGANRIPNLLSGKVDMLICLFGITPERALQVWYLDPLRQRSGDPGRARQPQRQVDRRSRAA